MKVYRGPKTKELEDFSHELVDEIDICDIEPWVSSTSMEVNVTKDQKSKERRSIVTLHFTESDIENLYKSLVKGRDNQNRRIEAMKKEREYFESALQAISRIEKLSKIQGQDESLKKIAKIVQSALD